MTSAADTGNRSLLYHKTPHTVDSKLQVCLYLFTVVIVEGPLSTHTIIHLISRLPDKMKSFVAFLFTLLLSSAFAQEMVATPPMPEQKAVESNLRGRDLQSCRPTARLEGQCFGLGQTVNIYVTTCAASSPEWIGIFPAGILDFRAAFAWKYVCGTQSCATIAPPGFRTVSFGYDSAGSTSWPLLPGRLYQVYVMTSTIGPLPTATFQITAGFSCGRPVVTPPTTGSRGPTLRF